MKTTSIVIFFAILFMQCSSPKKSNIDTESLQNELNRRLPKVLFITTGIDFKSDIKDLPSGITVAIQTFNKRGIPVRLEPRNVLFDYQYLTKFSIIILSTSRGYHDADRSYSLTYMTDEEQINLKKFVKTGGVLISGDNVGRNYFNGKDRILENQQLGPDVYPLSEAFGLIQIEKNMKSFEIHGNITDTLKGKFSLAKNKDLWTLVPSKIISKSLKTLASWRKNEEEFPAITQNYYGKGITFLLALSDFINPKSNDSYWSIDQIKNFYNYVANLYCKKNNLKTSINPWPHAYNKAFCATFNATGSINNFNFIFKKLNELKIKPTFFVNGLVNDSITNIIKSNNTNISSTGYQYLNYTELNYPIATNDILKNENKWNTKFKGFRFPYTNPDFTGMTALDLNFYRYESSISVNNLEFVQGSVFPYNLVIADEKFYKSTNILEIGPTYHDDYYFLNKLTNKTYANPEHLKNDVKLYEQYLKDFWEFSVKPHNGLMVFLGHPGIVGYNNTTFSSFKNFFNTIKNENVWITTIDEVAEFRNKFEQIEVYEKHDEKKSYITIKCPNNISIKNFTINLRKKPKKVKIKKGKVNIKKHDNVFSMVFDAHNDQVITIIN